MEEKNMNILGTYEGECADANITNLNGLDITREVWEHVFASDEYKRGIENGWLIGYLGHPEDPGCQNFQDACIVMTEGHIDDDGKVHGKFNLVDTPVGRIVDTFQKAGVRFGISVRGAGDIYNNSVDPDTFCFRGFDLVAFPAYPDSIPQFVAASEDPVERKNYERICTSVKTELPAIQASETLETLKTYFAPQSDVYQAIIEREDALIPSEGDAAEVVEDEVVCIDDQKVEALTQLYLSKVQEVAALTSEIGRLQKQLSTSEVMFSRKLDAMRRITSSQMGQLDSMIVASENNVKDVEKQLTASNDKVSTLSKKVLASKQLHDKDVSTINKLKSELNAAHEALNLSNLKYNQSIKASTQSTKDKDAVIASVRKQLAETVDQVNDLRTSVSNRDSQLRRQEKWIASAKKLISEYQDAYANIYANAIGARIDNISVTESTSVSELQSLITGSTSLHLLDTDTDIESPDIFTDVPDDCDLVTL